MLMKQKYLNMFGVLPCFFKGIKKNPAKDNETFSTDLNKTNSDLFNFATLITSPFEKLVNIPFGLSEYVVLEKV